MPPPPRTRARRPPLGTEVRPLLRPDLPGALCMQGSYGSRTVASHRTTSSSTSAYARLMIVVPGLHMAERTAGGRCYLVEHPLGCVLIDTGAPDGTLGASHLLESAGRRPEEVRLILLTHGHRGHAGNAAGLR